jgi:hypothetical protein
MLGICESESSCEVVLADVICTRERGGEILSSNIHIVLDPAEETIFSTLPRSWVE